MLTNKNKRRRSRYRIIFRSVDLLSTEGFESYLS